MSCSVGGKLRAQGQTPKNKQNLLGTLHGGDLIGYAERRASGVQRLKGSMCWVAKEGQ
jgi:hypothetical protein